MKKLSTIATLLTLVLFCITLEGCWDTVKPGIKTSANGTVTDPVLGKGLPQALITVYGCSFYFDGGARCGEVIDTARTDATGKYELNFTSDGNNTGYGIEFTPDYNYCVYSADLGTGTLNPPPSKLIQLNPGKNNVQNFEARQLTFLKAHIQIDTNAIGPLYVGEYAATPYRGATIAEQTRDTTVLLRIIPQVVNVIEFSVYIDSIKTYWYHGEVIQATDQDTLKSTITIPNVRRWAP